MILLLMFIIGINFGSFITLLSYRVPLNQDYIFKPSYCPECNQQLKIIDLIPIFSWCVNLAKCRYCHKSISLRYPFIEIIFGFITIRLFYEAVNYTEFVVHFIIAILLFSILIMILERSRIGSYKFLVIQVTTAIIMFVMNLEINLYITAMISNTIIYQRYNTL